MGASRYDDSDRLQFLIDRSGLTLIYAKTEFRWAVVDLETQGMGFALARLGPGRDRRGHRAPPARAIRGEGAVGASRAEVFCVAARW